MSITVSQALRIGGLTQGRILAGARNLNNVVEQVNVMEAVPEANWESGWEAKSQLLLTTFNAAKDDVATQLHFIEIFTRGGCAGIVFQPSIIPTLSPRVIQRAEELGVPLIEVPTTVMYPEIITPLVGAILREKSFLLQRALDIHTSLTEVILCGQGLDAIASALQALINCPVAITDAWGSVLGMAGATDSPDVIAHLVTQLARKGKKWTSAPIRDDLQRMWVVPLLTGHDRVVEGFIVVSDPDGQLGQLDMIAVEQAGIIATLEKSKQKAVLEAERRLKRDFIDDILSGSYQSVEAVMARAHSLGWELVDKRMVAVIDLNGFEQYYLAHLEQGEEHFQHIKDRFLQAVSQVVRKHNPQSILVDQSDSIILLPHFEADTSPARAQRDIQALAEVICSHAQQELNGLGISVAIGRYFNTLDGLRNSYLEARAALKIASKIARHRSIICYDDVALYVFLDRLLVQAETRDWLEQTLGSLVEYDRKNGTELVKTLEVYFDANQMAQHAAHQLFVHPKTLKYRLRRIEEILGEDPFSGDRQLGYYLASKLAKLV